MAERSLCTSPLGIWDQNPMENTMEKAHSGQFLLPWRAKLGKNHVNKESWCWPCLLNAWPLNYLFAMRGPSFLRQSYESGQEFLIMGKHTQPSGTLIAQPFDSCPAPSRLSHSENQGLNTIRSLHPITVTHLYSLHISYEWLLHILSSILPSLQAQNSQYWNADGNVECCQHEAPVWSHYRHTADVWRHARWAI